MSEPKEKLIADESAKPEKKSGGSKADRSFFLNSNSIGAVILKCLLLFVIPYIYLLLCGLIFDRWLSLYQLTSFVFYSLVVLYAAALAVIIWAVARFVRARRHS